MSSLRVVLLASILSACGGAPTAGEPTPSGSEASGAGSENGVAPPPLELPGMSLDPTRPVASLDAAERHLLGDWIRANAPHREATCSDGHVRHVGIRADRTDDDFLPPVGDPSQPEACVSLTVLDIAGCQYVEVGMDPCDMARRWGAFEPTGACGAMALCMAAALDAASHAE